MFNARRLYIDDINTAKEEIKKIGVDEASVAWLYPKALHYTVKLENVSPFAANIIKQEMLGNGGDAAVNRGSINCSIEKTQVLIMGTLNQYKRLVYKLGMQPGSLKQIAQEIQDILKGQEEGKPEVFKCRKYALPLGRKTYIMGILNLTPDSFSDGGKYWDFDAAVKRAKELVQEGADIIDVGGESTRPGHEPVDADEEIKRVIPVVERLSQELTVPISIDTYKALVAEKALSAGASIINDVWGMQRDPMIAGVAAQFDAGVVMMHNQSHKEYQDLMGDILKFLKRSIEIAESAGVKKEFMMVDPGIGFGKTYTHNLEVMKRLKEFSSLNLPVLLGTSRKSFIGNTLDLPIDERVEGTGATVALGISCGVDVVRVHDVKEMARVAKMSDAILRQVDGESRNG
ncbi:MAG: dihydropteroate synthase [Clostridia bacterium]|nr:dihydropteroate synthase [Clostridia bacterium]